MHLAPVHIDSVVKLAIKARRRSQKLVECIALWAAAPAAAGGMKRQVVANALQTHVAWDAGWLWAGILHCSHHVLGGRGHHYCNRCVSRSASCLLPCAPCPVPHALRPLPCAPCPVLHPLRPLPCAACPVLPALCCLPCVTCPVPHHGVAIPCGITLLSAPAVLAVQPGMSQQAHNHSECTFKQPHLTT